MFSKLYGSTVVNRRALLDKLIVIWIWKDEIIFSMCPNEKIQQQTWKDHIDARRGSPLQKRVM